MPRRKHDATSVTCRRHEIIAVKLDREEAEVINLTANDPLSATVVITKVDLKFIVPNFRPRRICEGTSVRLAKLVDVVVVNKV